VLRDWVAYAAERRGVTGPALQEALTAVETHREELLDAVADPEVWGPAKAFAVAAERSGVDLADPVAVDGFVERYNDGLGPA